MPVLQEQDLTCYARSIKYKFCRNKKPASALFIILEKVFLD